MDALRWVETHRSNLAPYVAAGLLLAPLTNNGDNIDTHQSQPQTEVSVTDSGVYVPPGELSMDSFNYEKLLEQVSKIDRPRLYSPIQFAEIATEDGTVVVNDTSDSLSPEVQSWFSARTKNYEPLILAALDSGGTDKIELVLENLYAIAEDLDFISNNGGSYNPKEDLVELKFSAEAPFITRAATEDVLVHEIVHGLFETTGLRSSDETRLSPEAVEQFRLACASLRSLSLDSIQNQTAEIQTALQEIIDKTTHEGLAERSSKLLKHLVNGSWINLQPTSSSTMISLDRYDHRAWKVPECAVVGLDTMMAAAYGDGDRSFYDEYNDAAKYDDADTSLAHQRANLIFDHLIRDVSLYSLLTDGNYLEGFPSAGHPYDNISETAASTITIMITQPGVFAERTRYLPQAQQKAVLEMVRVLVDQLSEAHPKLIGYLADKEAYFLSQLYK